MLQTTPCPETQDLHRFFLGQDDETAAGQIENHLAGCPDCVAVLDGIDVSDEVVEAAQAQTRRGDSSLPTPRIAGLIERLKALRGPTEPTAPIEVCTRLLAPAEEADEIGRLGGYRILQVLGSGGMGIVYLAEDTRLRRRVALKVLRPALAEDVRARQRFLQEARATAAISSDHIVPVYEADEDRGLPFLAMPVLHGETLGDRLAREGRLPSEEVVRIGRQVARGLAAAHAAGLVHRDVKPSNIWLEPDSTPGSPGRVKLLDFGLVQVAGDRRGLTDYGTVVGTPEYMAPEQASGEPVDARCDLFSLGSVLYAMAAGCPPFAGRNSLAVLRSVREDTPPSLKERAPDLPDYLVALITRLQAKNPAQRCRSAPEVIDWLDRGAACVQPISRARSARRRWLLSAATVLLVIAGLTAGTSQLGRHSSSPVPVAAVGDEDETDKQAAAADAPQTAAGVPLAIFPFQEKSSGVKDLGSQISELLFARLAARDDLILVERADLEKALKELELGLSGAVKPDSAPRVGQLTGARLLLSGSIFQADKKRHLVAKLVSVETGRIVGLSAEAPASGELSALVKDLTDKLIDKMAHLPQGVLPSPAKPAERVAALKQKLGNQQKPVLWIQVRERAAARPTVDPAAQTELVHLARQTGFEVIDPEEGARGQAQVLITGEGLSEAGGRHGELVTVKARLEIKAVDRVSGKVLAVERQTALVVDATEQLAGKAALQQAADAIGHRLLPKLVKR